MCPVDSGIQVAIVTPPEKGVKKGGLSGSLHFHNEADGWFAWLL